MQISVDKNFKDLTNQLSKLASPKGYRSAINTSINKTATTLRAKGAKELAPSTELSAAKLKKLIKLRKSTVKALRAVLTVSGKKPPLILFQAKETAKGVSAVVGGRRRQYVSSFIATMKSGKKGVFKRRYASRLPIFERFGPSLPDVFLKAEFDKFMHRNVNTLMEKNLNSQLARFTAKAK